MGALLNEWERSAARAAAESRRVARQAQSIAARAHERELVRRERAAERERIRAERNAEVLAAQERVASGRRSIALEKEAQRIAWKREHEYLLQRDLDLLSIGNESPEVEDRDDLYLELMKRREFEPEPFIAEVPRSDQIAEVNERYAREVSLLRPDPPLSTLTTVQLAFGVLATVAGGLMLLVTAPVQVPLIAVFLGIGPLIAEAQRGRRYAAEHQRLCSSIEVERQKALRALASEVLEASQEQYRTQVEAQRASYEQDAAARQRHLELLKEGDVRTIEEELAQMFPLELPVACSVAHTVVDPRSLRLELSVPAPSVLPATESRLLATGKLSSKAKTQKRLQAEYQRLVAGLALRHASEAMLLLPSIIKVRVSCQVSVDDPATGRAATTELLWVDYDYETLAPLQMPDIDPVAALENFPHQDSFGPARKKR